MGALGLALAVATVALAASAKTTRVSVNSSGDQANGSSYWASVSADGRYVAFVSVSTNLAPGRGILVRDRKTNTTQQAVASATQPSISADGRFVAYFNGGVFVYDRNTGESKLVSRNLAGQPAGGLSAAPSISADGRYVAFSSDAKDLTPLQPKARRNEFVRDTKTGKTEQVNVSSSGKAGNGDCHHPSISANGRYVAFESSATNLVKGTKKKTWRIFVRDLKKHKTKLASLSSAEKKANGASHNASISGDGRYVTFESTASDLVKHDTNKTWDVFRRDLKKGKTIRVSVTKAGRQANGASRFSSLSNHGGFIAFESLATNLVKGDTNHQPDVFFRNEHSGKTVRASVSSNGTQANRGSFGGTTFGNVGPPSVSADGRFVGFDSDATNLVPGDNNGFSDVFLRGPLHG